MSESSNPSNPSKGQCRCGQVRFQMTCAPLITMACHCRGCQRMTASAYSLSNLYPSDAFELVTGEPVIGGIHGPTRHYFCPHCMSWLFTRPEGLDGFINVRTTMLEDILSFNPFLETCTDEKLPWTTTGAIHSFEKFPPPDSFPALLRAYAERN